jgi:predicted nucleotidyltransferase
VILFGSQARGEAGSHSDVDLLVVLDEVEDRRQEAIRIRQALADLPIAKDVFVATPEEIRLRGNLVGTILRPALREGKILYERT